MDDHNLGYITKLNFKKKTLLHSSRSQKKEKYN
jgi:hypothetical protein